MIDNFLKYVVLLNEPVSADTNIIQFVPVDSSLIYFQPGQYCSIQNPAYIKPTETHSFSFASTPGEKYIELCVKQYGPWTHAFCALKKGALIFLSGPMGEVVWDSQILSAVFLVGGVGIAPAMSILRFVHKTNRSTRVALLYGARTPEDVIYKSEIERIAKDISTCKVVYIYSHLPLADPWSGNRGFMTIDFLRNESNLASHPTFYMFGPPVFVNKMDHLLQVLGISRNRIRKEIH